MEKNVANQTTDRHPIEVGKKNYHAPQLRNYGSLAELVQFRPNRGRDGETRWIDCTSG